MAQDTMHFVVFLGSVREGRMATRVGKYVRLLLEERSHNVTVIDPLDVGFAEVIQPLQFYPDPEEAPAGLIELNRLINEADGFVVVSSEYNSVIPPALSSLLDNFPPASFSYRPSAIITYSMGLFGGIRAASLLRGTMSEMTTLVCPAIFLIPQVHNVLDETGNVVATRARMEKMSSQLFDQLEWYTKACRNERRATKERKEASG